MKKLLVRTNHHIGSGTLHCPGCLRQLQYQFCSCNGFGNGNTSIHKTTVIGSHNGNDVRGQNAASAGNGVAIGSSVTVTQSASR